MQFEHFPITKLLSEPKWLEIANEQWYCYTNVLANEFDVTDCVWIRIQYGLTNAVSKPLVNAICHAVSFELKQSFSDIIGKPKLDTNDKSVINS